MIRMQTSKPAGWSMQTRFCVNSARVEAIHFGGLDVIANESENVCTPLVTPGFVLAHVLGE